MSAETGAIITVIIWGVYVMVIIYVLVKNKMSKGD